MLAAGKLVNLLYQNFCHLTGYTTYISGYIQTFGRFHLRSEESEKCYLYMYFSESSLAVHLER